MDKDKLLEKIRNKELTICETCDTIFAYIQNKIFCDECKRKNVNAQSRAYREKNLEKEIARNKAYRKKNHARELVRKRAYRVANIEKVRATDRALHKKNSGKINAVKRAYRAANLEKVRAQERARRYARKRRLSVKDIHDFLNASK